MFFLVHDLFFPFITQLIDALHHTQFVSQTISWLASSFLIFLSRVLSLIFGEGLQGLLLWTVLIRWAVWVIFNVVLSSDLADVLIERGVKFLKAVLFAYAELNLCTLAAL